MIQINTTGTKELFRGAYDMRLMENRMREAAQAQAEQPRQTARDVGLEDVKLSAESEEFLARAGERKAAAAEANAAQAGQVQADPFAGTGDARQQYLVFSEHLYNNGFFDSMSDEEVRQTEGLLRSITAGMDSISPGSLLSTSSKAPTHAAAQVEYAASVEALEAFADSRLSGSLRTSFGGLIRSYASHNAPIVSSHTNLVERRDKALANLPQTTTMGILRGYPKDEATEAAAKKLGRIEFGETADKSMRQLTAETFNQVRKGHSTLDAGFSKLREDFLSYATGNSTDGSVRSLAGIRNSHTFQTISAYWSAMASMSIF